VAGPCCQLAHRAARCSPAHSSSAKVRVELPGSCQRSAPSGQLRLHIQSSSCLHQRNSSRRPAPARLQQQGKPLKHCMHNQAVVCSLFPFACATRQWCAPSSHLIMAAVYVCLAYRRYPQGESYIDLVQRLWPVVHQLEQRQGPVVVVAHQVGQGVASRLHLCTSPGRTDVSALTDAAAACTCAERGVHVQMPAHNKSGNAYQDKGRRPESAVNPSHKEYPTGSRGRHQPVPILSSVELSWGAPGRPSFLA
jgi:hypothetical protein